ncbi:hypothetical protein KBC54_03350 [Patescibacteria group bacterium]|nr:hypothetical protein [Patescibacteria group bacterium]
MQKHQLNQGFRTDSLPNANTKHFGVGLLVPLQALQLARPPPREFIRIIDEIEWFMN